MTMQFDTLVASDNFMWSKGFTRKTVNDQFTVWAQDDEMVFVSHTPVNKKFQVQFE